MISLSNQVLGQINNYNTQCIVQDKIHWAFLLTYYSTKNLDGKAPTLFGVSYNVNARQRVSSEPPLIKTTHPVSLHVTNPKPSKISLTKQPLLLSSKILIRKIQSKPNLYTLTNPCTRLPLQRTKGSPAPSFVSLLKPICKGFFCIFSCYLDWIFFSLLFRICCYIISCIFVFLCVCFFPGSFGGGFLHDGGQKF